jgi:hypothetical protein
LPAISAAFGVEEILALVLGVHLERELHVARQRPFMTGVQRR